MVCETTNVDRSPLLPDRYPTPDFFVCDIFDAAPKGDMASMEHPVFSISTKPDHRVRRYEQGNCYLEVKPSSDGLATVHDRDVLIYCISQVMAAINNGREVSQTIRFHASEMLTATNRPTGGESYTRLKAALSRLAGTRIETNITTGDMEVLDGFGLIDRFRVVRETREGRMQEIEIRLSDWVFNAIRGNEVLTLHRDYFRLRKPLERRIYEIARKHCARQNQWSISLERLQEKCGSGSRLKEFRRLVGNIVEEDKKHGHMPDYAITLNDDDKVVFQNRRTMPALPSSSVLSLPPLDPETIHDARSLAPGWDIHELERKWRAWVAKNIDEGGGEPPRDPSRAFMGFCQKWFERNGSPR
jgi:plasmid replication initiation protein